jgi:hypothetical protein
MKRPGLAFLVVVLATLPAARLAAEAQRALPRVALVLGASQVSDARV